MMRKWMPIGLAMLYVVGIAPSVRAQSTTPVQYFYDDLGRLIKVVDQNGNVASYHYDAVGNLLSITRSTLPGGSGLSVLSFTPQRGSVGATVTIQGQGFSSAPSSDTVQFNGTMATVTAATASTLTVTVPPGATTGPISVSVGGSAATSDANFTVLPVTLVSIAVSPVSPTVYVGQNQQFAATDVQSELEALINSLPFSRR